MAFAYRLRLNRIQRRIYERSDALTALILERPSHHLDVELLGLDEPCHTEGFYKRESSLFKQLVRGTGL